MTSFNFNVRIISRVAMTLSLMLLTTATAWADLVETYYVVANGTSHNVTATVLTGMETSLGTADETTYYVVNNNISHTKTIECEGRVILILADDCTMTASAGINIANTLNIYSQQGGSGMLTVNGMPCGDGIDGGNGINGNIFVNGGTINITGSDGGDGGIGGYEGHVGGMGINGSLTVNGGAINITGGKGGKGYQSFHVENPSVSYYYNGSTGGIGGYGIKGPLTINGGIINITGGAGGQGGENREIMTHGGSGGKGGEGIKGTLTVNGGILTINGGNGGAGGRGRAGRINPGSPGSAGHAIDGTMIFDAATTVIIESDDQSTWNILTTGSTSTKRYIKIGDSFTVSDDGNTYTIYNTIGWDEFCNALDGGESFSGKTVKLNANIEVSRMAGSGNGGNLTESDHPFCGTFDGGGKTLTFNYGSSDNPADENYLAPFRYVNNATIEHLHVDGDIYTQHVHAGGIIGMAYGTTNVTDCRSSVNIISSINGDGTHSGIMSSSWTGSTTNITGCLFDGSIRSADGYSTDQCGGFVGWRNATINVTNCLLTADLSTIAVGTGSYPSATFVRHGDANTIINCYYIAALGTVQGKKAYAVDAAPANLGAAVTGVDYRVLTSYENGILFDGKYYVAADAVSLNDTEDNDMARVNGYVADVTLTGRTLFKDGSWNTLCLPFNLTLSGSVLDGDNVELMTLGDASFSQGTLSLSFVDADEIEAGKPYIIRWDNTGSHIVNPVFKGVTIVNASLDENAVTKNDVISFKGIYSPFEITEANNKLLYLGDDNQIYYPSAAMTINAFRAYFELQGDLVCGEPSSTDNGINAFVLNFGDETTSIDHLPLTIDHETIEHSPLTIDHEAWYDLSGRKLNAKPTQRGLYIHNGRKVVIK